MQTTPKHELIDVGIQDLPARLTFLRMLRDRTVFADHAMLKAIIGDYERAQRAAWSREERPRRRATDAKALPAPLEAPGRPMEVTDTQSAEVVLLRIPPVACD